MPDASRRVAGGTRESTVRARQTTAAAAEHPRHERASGSLAVSSMNRRMPNGTYGGVGGGSRKAPTYPITQDISPPRRQGRKGMPALYIPE